MNEIEYQLWRNQQTMIHLLNTYRFVLLCVLLLIVILAVLGAAAHMRISAIDRRVFTLEREQQCTSISSQSATNSPSVD